MRDEGSSDEHELSTTTNEEDDVDLEHMDENFSLRQGATCDDHSPPSSLQTSTRQTCTKEKVKMIRDDSKTSLTSNGALRQGSAPRLLSAESVGLIAQYAAVGLVYGVLPSTITPFLTYYLNMEGTATTSARALLSIPWSFKVFIGILSDCLPLFGYRRRPYMVLGWTVTVLCLLVMASSRLEDPYFPDPEMRKIKPADYSVEMVQSLNRDAPSSGARYIVLMMFATLGYLFADVAADAVVVEYAQREPEETRGRIQTAIYTVRSLFNIVAQIITGFGLSLPDYGGSFDFGLSFPDTMLLLAIFCLPVIPMTWMFVREEVVKERPMLKKYIGDLWDAVQTRAIYQVIAFSFLSGVFSGFTYVAQDPMTSYWVHATSFNLSLSSIFGSFVTVVTLALTGKYGLHWNWRTMHVVTMFCVLALDAVCTMLVTWNIVRKQWFWLGVPIVEAVPESVSFIISTYVVVELAGHGNEGAIYGLLTTVSNLGGPFALTLTKNVNAAFKVYNDDILNDTYEVRRDVTITILISYVMKLLSLLFLPLLPRQKAETQALKRAGGSSRRMGLFTISYLSFALVWAILTNLLGIFESTRCWIITGGCKE
ncbi:Major facilitator superfamily domain, general substrate transporter [Plasmopara halstedii]|uniref:Major facilitator superfamily domain, general substrate transporter n=1 Tax=Plasmopara halstedii TaxID=4781 RepID=A0A0P1B5B1_PLAHL|nr:Major facilitator superfamily domain, general substrate transporter [Plasmopara halstedii]CEG49990.1 Major facilitator superfamily domain, general substrate transporter [Plasmopara halstedii]|eukprot:XP_024586359.1 Major facilitator superfamily domain, general substrate transporter [Plasmopara halstedii]